MSTFNSLAPICYLAFVFGLMGPWWRHKSRAMQLLSVLIVSVHSVVLGFFLYFGNVTLPKGSAICVYLKYFVSLGYACIDLVVLLLCVLHRGRIQGIFRSLQEVDRLLLEANIQMNFPRMRRINWTILILFLGINVLQIAITCSIYPAERVLQPVVLYRLLYKQFCHQTFVVLLVCVTASVYQRFVALNEGIRLICQRRFLERNYHVDQIMCLVGVLKRPTKETICRFADIHDRLCAMLQAIGRAFGPQTFCYVALYLSLTLLIMYQSMDSQESWFRRIHSLKHDVPPLLKCVAFFVTMTATCTALKAEVKRTAAVVHKAGNTIRMAALRPQLDSLSLQIYHCDGAIRFTVLEFTWRLVSTVFSVSTTYLLVLIQFNRMAALKRQKQEA